MRSAPALELRVGEANPLLDAFLLREGLETAACVPSQPGLDEALCEQGYPGIGGASVLIVGLPRVAARDLGRGLRRKRPVKALLLE